MAHVELTQAQHRGCVHVAPGDVVVVRLSENPTTAYRWAFSLSGPAVQVSDDFAAACPPLPDGGERRMRIVARQNGTARLTAELRRTWETSTRPTDVFEVTLEVASRAPRPTPETLLPAGPR